MAIDFVSVLILLILLALFGWLTLRAWNAKRAVVKWPGCVLTGLVTLSLGLVAIFAAIGFYKLNERRTNPVADIRVAATPAQIARGERLANVCVTCHSWNDQVVLSGSDFIAKFGFPPVGILHSPNLTPAGNISDWSDGELIRAIREGVHKNGRSLLIMPVETFGNLSDDDVQAIVAYLRAQPATDRPTPTNQFNVLGALFMNLSDLRTAQPPVGSVSSPPPRTSEYGKYMVDVLGCRDCHGTRLHRPAVDRAGLHDLLQHRCAPRQRDGADSDARGRPDRIPHAVAGISGGHHRRRTESDVRLSPVLTGRRRTFRRMTRWPHPSSG